MEDWDCRTSSVGVGAAATAVMRNPRLASRTPNREPIAKAENRFVGNADMFVSVFINRNEEIEMIDEELRLSDNSNGRMCKSQL